jgi:hypothetical protein
MSYELYFMKEHRGKSPMEYFEDLKAGTASNDDASLIDIHEVSASLLDLGMGLHCHAHRIEDEGVQESIELTIPQPTHAQMRVLIEGASVTLTIPYWEQTAGSIAELRQHWDPLLSRMVRLGLLGYDPQQGEPISLDTFNTMVLALAGRERVTAPAETKPWWKVWQA